METSNKRDLQGLLVINKPYGMVSKDVSRRVQRSFGRQKLGHVGTLDPLASGVLPLVFGRATKVQDYLLDIEKTYEFDIKFGEATLTLDVEGEVYQRLDYAHLTLAAIVSTCSDLVGRFTQTPPLYSAVKFEGKPLYEYARSGRGHEVPLDLLKKDVNISKLEVLDFDGQVASLTMTCSKGTYVRVVADTIARRLGTCGHVSRLTRSSAAGFSLQDAVSLETIEADPNSIDLYLKDVASLSLNMPKWEAIDVDTVHRLKMGQQINLDMRQFEDGLDTDPSKRMTIHSIDRILLLDKDKRSFGIGRACVLNTGRMAVQMKRGLS